MLCDADPDSTYHPYADPDSTYHPDADPDSTYHPDADPDSDFFLLMRSGSYPSLQIKAQTLEKVLKGAHISYILVCHLQIDADPVPDQAHHFDADPDSDFYLMRMLILIVSRLPK